jgi:hypothetical protein
VKQSGMAREMLFDFGANLTAVHANRNITVIADIERSPCILVREPVNPPGRADRGVWRSDIDALALGKELLRSLPYRFESVDQPQDCAVTL